MDKKPTDGDKPWRTSEIVLVDDPNKGQKGVLGYGTYLVTVRADNADFSHLDPNLVFGIFIYQDSDAGPPKTPNTHREIDLLEVIRGEKSNAQFTLQPWSAKPHPWDPFSVPAKTPFLTAVLDWRQRNSVPWVNMRLYRGDFDLDHLPHPPLQQWTPSDPKEGFGKYVPWHTPASRERLHINLWLMHGKPPASEQSVTVTRFQFQPA